MNKPTPPTSSAPIGVTTDPDSPLVEDDTVAQSSEGPDTCTCNWDGKVYACNSWLCWPNGRMVRCTPKGWVHFGFCD